MTFMYTFVHASVRQVAMDGQMAGRMYGQRSNYYTAPTPKGQNPRNLIYPGIPIISIENYKGYRNNDFIMHVKKTM